MNTTNKVIMAISATVISFSAGVFIGNAEGGGDPYAAFFGRNDRTSNDRLPCPGPGDILTEDVLTQGCVEEGSATVRFLATWPCRDGRRLLSETRMYGFPGSPIIASDDTAADPDYAAAYSECLGN